MTAAVRVTRDCRHVRVRHAHGTRAAYNRDECRCPACTDANTAGQAALRRRHAHMRWNGQSMWTTSHGTVRRLQALAAAGWSLPEIAARLQVTPTAVDRLRANQRHRTLTATARRVADVYEQLWYATPPAGHGSSYVANRAARHGWAEPWQWADRDIDDPATAPAQVTVGIDDVAVARIMSGTLDVPKHVHSPERIEAVRRLASFGLTDSQIAERTRWKAANVLATRIRHGIPAGQPRARRAA